MTVQAAPTALEVEIRDLAPQTYVGKRFRTTKADVGSAVQFAFRELFGALATAHVAPAGPPFLTAAPPQQDFMDVEVGVPVATVPPKVEGSFAGTLPGGPAAVTTFVGPYHAIGAVYEALSTWIFGNGHAMAGPPREVYLTGPDDVKTPAEHVTEVVWPIGR